VPDVGSQPTSLLREYLGILQRRAWIVATVVAILTAGTLLLSLLQDPVYRATASVLLQPKPSESIGSTGAASPSDLLDTTELEVMRSQLVEDAVEEELGHEPDISLSGVVDTKVVRVSAKADDAAHAARDANTYARVYVRERRDTLIEELNNAITTLTERLTATQTEVRDAEAQLGVIEARIATAAPGQVAALQQERAELSEQLERTLTSGRARATAYQDQIDQLQLASSLTVTGGAQLITEAKAPDDPISPNPVRNTTVALLLGLVLGAGLAFLVNQLDDRILSKASLEAATGGLPTLGIIPFVASRDERANRLVPATGPHDPAGEAYRGLRTSLQFPALDGELRSVQITSANAGEGKTTTVANLALTLARAGKRVVILDADLRRPRLGAMFGIEPVAGLAAVMLGEVGLSEAIVEVPDEPRLGVLAIAGAPANPPELLALRQFANLVRDLERVADFVIVDSPPLLPVADALTVASVVDATVLVVVAERTTSKQVERAVELLRQVDAPLLGTVLNMVPARRHSETYYGYGYDRGYDAEGAPTRAEPEATRRTGTGPSGKSAPTPAAPAASEHETGPDPAEPTPAESTGSG
jgi:capsular exopolysaccharide synthesis family protein